MKKKNLHDELFKATFSMVSEVVAFSKIYLPKWLSESLDYDTLQHEPTSFVSEELSQYFSDIIYSCRSKNGSAIKITFLLEHKSYVPENIYIQLLRYLLETYDSQLQNEQSLTLVVPIVVYHGKDRWHKRPLSDYFDLPDAQWAQYLPMFNYELIDLGQISDKLIIQQQIGHYLRSTFLVFKHKSEKEFVEQFTEEIFIFVNKELDQDHKLAFLRRLMVYIFGAFNYEKQEFNNYVKKISDMTIDEINLGEILFGEEFTDAVAEEVKKQVAEKEKEINEEAKKQVAEREKEINEKAKKQVAEREKEINEKAKKQVAVKVAMKVAKKEKQQLLDNLTTLLSILKRFPLLKDVEYANMVKFFSKPAIKRIKLALQQPKNSLIKQKIVATVFKDHSLSATETRKLDQIIADYLK